MTKKTLGALLAFTLVAFSSMNAVAGECEKCCDKHYEELKVSEKIEDFYKKCLNEKKENCAEETSEYSTNLLSPYFKCMDYCLHSLKDGPCNWDAKELENKSKKAPGNK